MARKESGRMRELRERRELAAAQKAEREAEFESGEQFADEPSEITRLRESLGDGQFSVRISRKGDDGLFEKFPSMPLESFDPDSIASRFGGGMYKFDVIDSDGTYVKRFSVTYSKLIKPQGSEPVKNGSLLASPEFALIQQMTQQSAAAIQAANAQTMAMMSEMVKAMAQKPQGNDIKELIVALKGLKDLSGGDVAGEMVKGALGMAAKFMEMGRETASSADPESNILNKLIDFLPGVLSKLGEMKGPTQPKLPAPAPAAPVPIVPAPATPEPVKSDAYAKYPNVSLLVRQLGVKLVDLAKANADATQVAKELVAEIPENYDSEVDAFIQDKRAVDFMIEIFPPLSLYVDWIKKFVKAIDDEYQEEPEIVSPAKEPEPATV